MEVDYEVLDEGFVMVRPETYGWQHIGRGDYSFSVLVERHGHLGLSRHNWAPPNFREVSEAQIAVMHAYTLHPLIATTYKELVADHDGIKLREPICGHLFLTHTGKGYMVSFDFFKRRVRYFVFELCVHEFVQKKCTLCGFTKS